MHKQFTHRHPKLNLRTESDLLLFLNTAKSKDLNKTFKRKITLKDLRYLRDNSHLDWSDHPTESNPEKQKYVRSIRPGSNLNIANRRLDAAMRGALDKKVPQIFYGSVSEKSHIQAARILCNGRNSTIISLDVTRFFESISQDRVARFFYKAGCSREIAQMLAKLACVPLGPKDKPEPNYALARGFPTSPRLSLWATFEIFVKLNRVFQKKFAHLSPKIVVFVDDIGISVKGANEADIEAVKKLAFRIIGGDKRGVNLVVHKRPPKLKVRHISRTAEHLGLVIGKKSLSPGFKTRHKIGSVNARLSDKTLSREDRKSALNLKRGLMDYKRKIGQQ